MTTGCNKPDDITDELGATQEGSHYIYHYSQSNPFLIDSVWMEKHYSAVTGKLNISPAGKLHYFKMADRNQMKRLTGKNTNGFAVDLKFYTIWNAEGHESVHAMVIGTMGLPIPLFTEGIAVALAPQPIYGPGTYKPEPTWNGVPLDDLARTMKSAGKVPLLEDMLDRVLFYNNFDISYPLSGSFVKFILTRYGVDKLKGFFQLSSNQESSTKVRQVFFETYGIELSNAWQNWLQNL